VEADAAEVEDEADGKIVIAKEVDRMCGNIKCCRREREQVSDPRQCSPEQIRECHGEVTEHPCISEGKQCDVNGRK